jgi:hypothetical protein
MTRTLADDGAETAAHGASPADFLNGFISEAEYAARRGVSLRTCQRDRQLRQAPPFVTIGKRVFYRVEAVRAWLLARERSLERAPATTRGRRV